ncbi:efflux RND transporter periplasmic adaptor subunit [Trinickia sp. NRRL B-1857]|uniref:efflux RND transporter periplasmic adaptor subunit n=1 Tax=Trinickia sp. NRRL B-1857 TaxID=3162879 RepID=UPI003D26EA95
MSNVRTAASDGTAVRETGSGNPAPEAGSQRPTHRRKYVGYFAAAAAVVAAAGAAWWFATRPAPRYYVTQPITRGDISHSVSATGTVNPVLTIIVGSYVSGVIQQQFCDFNTQVRKGQLCAKIDPRPYQALVDQARADLANARAQILKDRAQLAYTKSASARNATLLQHGIVSRDTADNARSAYEQAQAQVAVDTAVIAQRSAGLRTAEVNLDYTNIVSPVDGTVVSRNITIGQTVAASFQTPTLFLIATDLTQMQVDANVSESDIGGLHENTPATFTVEAYPKRRFEGHVVQVRQAPQTVQNVVTYDVVIGVRNADLSLKPGMTATARIVLATRQHVLRVPDPALRFTPSGVSPSSKLPELPAGAVRIWVLRDAHPVAVTVTTGLDDDSYSEVTSGDIREGDTVIVGETAGNAAAPGVAGPRLRA